MTLMETFLAFKGALESLSTLCGSIKKYESAFSTEAKSLFQGMSYAADQALRELEHLPPTDDSVAGFLARGIKALGLRSVLQQVQQAVSGFTSGAVPVPRSSKEELSRVHGQVLSVKFSLPSEYHLAITQLRKLCVEVEAGKQDFDLIETNLDNTMRSVLQQVYGQALLEPEALANEVKRLQSCLADARTQRATQLEDILSLALNSIQRLHAGQDQHESDEDEDDAVSVAAVPGGELDEDEDDDDPFFIPMPTAIKWAEASKFKELAKPLTPEQPADKQFMIVMEDDEASRTPSSIAGISVEPSLNTVSSTPAGPESQRPMVTDSAESSPAPAAAAASGEEATAAATAKAVVTTKTVDEPQSPEATEPRSGGSQDEPGVSESGVATPASVLSPAPQTPGTATGKQSASGTPAVQVDEEIASATDEQARRDVDGKGTPQPLLLPTDDKAADAGAGTGKPGTPVPTTESPTPEKLTDFVNFLNGENPGACMFHAQMRLSAEGCMKLANFLRSSARVRALSLSHNYLGDAGLKLICDGLRENKSVTALDLPDNNITDIGAAILAESIKDNPSLTQLQLAYNKIGDQGAMALAQVIRTSTSLKKLGLAFNNIGKAGCQALTSAISSNQSLKHMQLLPGNPVEEKDAKALAKALKRNNKFSIKQLLGLKPDA